MTTTVIGTIESSKAAQALGERARPGRAQQAGRRGARGRAEKEIVSTIVGRGFDEGDARGYAKAAAAARPWCSPPRPRGRSTRRWRSSSATRRPAPREGARSEAGTVQEVREELEVGKRKVATGGVRVTSSVSEVPVEETVTLREEKVAAERKNVDRKLSPEEAEAAFKGRTVEATSTSEEAEVTKQARVVGEVSIGKQTKEREETVRDTVRRTEVEVEKVEAGAPRRVGAAPPPGGGRPPSTSSGEARRPGAGLPRVQGRPSPRNRVSPFRWLRA
jgi:uncharacterized protein (TIGR02271 family)